MHVAARSLPVSLDKHVPLRYNNLSHYHRRLKLQYSFISSPILVTPG